MEFLSFRNRAPAGMVALNAFIGGARQPELTDLSDEQIIQITLDELKSIMQFSGKPVYLESNTLAKIDSAIRNRSPAKNGCIDTV